MVTSITPMRVSFVGGGTDLPGFFNRPESDHGAVISMTIDKFVVITVRKHFYDDEINLRYRDSEEKVKSVDDIKFKPVRETLKFLGMGPGLQISILTDVPGRGTGLGASSSFIVGLLNVLYEFKGERVSKETLAKEAIEIEREILKEEGGFQDQYAAAYGGLSYMKFRRGEVEVRDLGLSEKQLKYIENHILFLHTGIDRDGVAIHKTQAATMDEKIDHYVKLRKLADETSVELQKGNIEVLGKALRKGWELKRELGNGITNPEIDKLCELAISNGAEGVKIIGAGGGGFLLVWAEQQRHAAILDALKLRRIEMHITNQGSRIASMEI